ncbi:hypothetical protein J6590_014876 [Homalodisca vitripennis]|nr:hypothetical protein J6590_014876 [Homalodisca vitripennis]
MFMLLTSISLKTINSSAPGGEILNAVHAEEGFTCDRCGKKYKWDTSLMRHKRLECGKTPQFSCDFCSYKAKHKNSLKTHLALKHNQFNY